MSRLKFTLKAWPVITIVTIGLCYTTQAVAGLFGIELPDQANVDLVRRVLSHSFESMKHFGASALLVAQVLIIMPIIEELIFRLPTRWLRNKGWWAFFSLLFSAAHYLAQPWPDAAFVALFFFGLAQCWLYKKTAHLWCAALDHALFNLTNLILLFLV